MVSLDCSELGIAAPLDIGVSLRPVLEHKISALTFPDTRIGYEPSREDYESAAVRQQKLERIGSERLYDSTEDMLLLTIEADTEALVKAGIIEPRKNRRAMDPLPKLNLDYRPTDLLPLVQRLQAVVFIEGIGPMVASYSDFYLNLCMLRFNHFYHADLGPPTPVKLPTDITTRDGWGIVVADPTTITDISFFLPVPLET